MTGIAFLLKHNGGGAGIYFFYLVYCVIFVSSLSKNVPFWQKQSNRRKKQKAVNSFIIDLLSLSSSELTAYEFYTAGW
ncbi:MAG: hypothetical protein ABIH42_06680 [Planctomycetota bacterium]